MAAASNSIYDGRSSGLAVNVFSVSLTNDLDLRRMIDHMGSAVAEANLALVDFLRPRQYDDIQEGVNMTPSCVNLNLYCKEKHIPGNSAGDIFGMVS